MHLQHCRLVQQLELKGVAVEAWGLLKRCRHRLVVGQVVVVARQSMQLLVVRRPLRHSQLQAGQQTRVAGVVVLQVVQVWQQELLQLVA